MSGAVGLATEVISTMVGAAVMSDGAVAVGLALLLLLLAPDAFEFCGIPRTACPKQRAVIAHLASI